MQDNYKDFVNYLLEERKVSIKTAQIYIDHLKSIRAWWGGEEFNKNTMVQYAKYLQSRDVKPSSINLYIGVWNLHIDFLMKYEIPRNGIEKVKHLPKSIRKVDYLSETELSKLLNIRLEYRGKFNLKGVEIDRMYRTLIMFCALTGCFIREAQKLIVEDFKVDAKQITLGEKHRRTLEIEDPLLVFYLSKLIKGKLPGDLIFTNAKLSPVNLSDISTDLKLRAKAAGIEKTVNTTLLRRTFIMKLFENGFTLEQVAAIVGHVDLNTSKMYDTFHRYDYPRIPLVRTFTLDDREMLVRKTIKQVFRS